MSWNAADGRGTPITEYVITWNGGSKTVDGSARSADITGLANGTAYTFSVQARNGHEGGEGELARSKPYTPFTKPSAPTMKARSYSCPADGSACPVTYDVVVTEVGGGKGAYAEFRVTQNGKSGGWGKLDLTSAGRAAFSLPSWGYNDPITVESRIVTTPPAGGEKMRSAVNKQTLILKPGASGP